MAPNPIVGFLVSPLAVPLVIALYILWNGSGHLPLASLLAVAAFSYFVMLVAGLPFHFALKAIQVQRWWAYALCGALLGGLFSWYVDIELSSPDYALLPGAASLSGLIWWALASSRSPSTRYRERKSNGAIS